MKIELKKLTLINFKGIKNLAIEFTNGQTNIFGDNATGKTTVFDAFTWLLWGKDSHDRKDFEIKPLDITGAPSSKIENEVSAELLIDDRQLSLRRVYKEKWQKKRGEAIATFTGNETLYFYNDVPLQQGEYQAKIDNILNENVFKMITSPLYFNALPWQNKRQVLMQIAGEISDSDILEKITTPLNGGSVSALEKILSSGKSITEYKKEISAKKKKIKDELEAIPTRIDEISRGLPQPLDYTGIQKQIDSVAQELTAVDDSITSKNDAYKKQNEKLQGDLKTIHDLKIKRDSKAYEIKTSLSKATSEKQSAISEKRLRLQNIDREIVSKNSQITQAVERIDSLRKNMDAQREKWHLVNGETLAFNENEFVCPACKRELEAGEIEKKKQEMQSNFNTDKQQRLTAINKKGSDLNSQVVEEEKDLKQLRYELEVITRDVKPVVESELKALESDQGDQVNTEGVIAADPDIQNLDNQISAAQQDAQGNKPEIDVDALRKQKAEINQRLDELKKQFNTKEQIQRANARVQELEAEQRALAQQLADLEGTEFLIELFTKKQIDVMESRINSLFKYVTFKMFKQLINGAAEECCETVVGGVPYSDLNTAAKINAGLDIINVLSMHYSASAPIFIDNRESINSLIGCESQLVNLVVSKDKALRVA